MPTHYNVSQLTHLEISDNTDIVLTMRPFFFVAILIGVLTVFSTSSFSAPGNADPDADYDRLDGHGRSGKRVNVIEWEGNLEIHVYPAGSLIGLGLKLDKKNKDKNVMVISYRFDNGDHPLIRRAILGISMNEGFKAFRDPSADGYDKIIISNQGLSNQVAVYKLDPPPTQLYPDGHPANEIASAKSPAASGRTPAKIPKKPVETPVDDDEASQVDENGTIQPFYMKREPRSRAE